MFIGTALCFGEVSWPAPDNAHGPNDDAKGPTLKPPHYWFGWRYGFATSPAPAYERVSTVHTPLFGEGQTRLAFACYRRMRQNLSSFLRM
jgi:hypothetical protein